MTKETEDNISMVLGLAVVLVTIGITIWFFRGRRGVADVPGIATETPSLVLTTPAAGGQGSIARIVPDGKSGTTEYEVKAGDSLWKISQRLYNNGFYWSEIAKVNKINNPSLLVVGQKLTLPAIGGGSETASGEYVVKKGDSLWSISVTNLGDGFRWTEIWNLNREVIKSPGVLEIGWKLKLPMVK